MASAFEAIKEGTKILFEGSGIDFKNKTRFGLTSAQKVGEIRQEARRA